MLRRRVLNRGAVGTTSAVVAEWPRACERPHKRFPPGGAYASEGSPSHPAFTTSRTSHASAELPRDGLRRRPGWLALVNASGAHAAGSASAPRYGAWGERLVPPGSAAGGGLGALRTALGLLVLCTGAVLGPSTGSQVAQRHQGVREKPCWAAEPRGVRRGAALPEC